MEISSVTYLRRGWGMDKAQTDNSTDKKTNAHNNANEHANTAQDEIQLADILKPSTLIIALVTFVLAILFGWYVYVLKPALNENESMIQFMESHHQDNVQQINPEKATIKNSSENNLQPVPESSIAASNASEHTNTIEKNGVEQNISQNKPMNNKTVKFRKHKTHKHPHALKSTIVAQKSSSSANPPKCTQAQVSLQQC